MTTAIYVATIIHVNTLMHHLYDLSKIQQLDEQQIESKKSCETNSYL